MTDFKDTLNLPQTEFPMRANLAQREPETLAVWESEGYYEKMREARNAGPRFLLHCGPPYANGRLHAGHLIPSLLKDIVVRFKSMGGYDTPYIPGWDCHGLPIEWKVEKDLQEKGKSKADVSTSEFRALCREYAAHWVKEQMSDWKRMGAIADWQEPYLTMNYQNEADIVREFGRVAGKGILYKDYKPVMWSPVEQTALAEAEIEYQDKESTALYFKMPLADVDNEHLVAWTTTPWSIPSNRAVAVGAEIDYVSLKPATGRFAGQTLWVAEALAAKLAKVIGAEEYETTGHKKGQDFIGREAKQPLYGNPVPVVAGHHVTTEDGTGIVHIAPAHGIDDFKIGQQNGLDLSCAVDEAGKFAAGVAQLPMTGAGLAGQKINAAEGAILAELEASGGLLASHKIKHSYPVSWRSKAPLITRSTSQWFVAMDKPYTNEGATLRDVALREIDKTEWIPEEGRSRIRGMMVDRPDWCISRQRLWGVPITIFRNLKNGEYITDPAVFEAVARQIEKHGIEAWDDLPVSQLLPRGWLKKHGLTGADLAKEKDILDVWFDAGSSYAHVLQRRGLGTQADLYLEGSDQHRGWFHSSLLISAAVNEQAPYQSVLTHGFVVDGKGKKVSKSLGNGADAVELIDQYGADVLRLWVASADYKTDLRFSPEIMKGVNESYRKFRNTLRYTVSNLYDFDPMQDVVGYAELPELEKWVLARYSEVANEFAGAMDEYKFSRAFTAMQNFCTNDLSGFYFDVRKDALYSDSPNSHTRRSCQTVLNHLFDGVVTHLTPLMPFTCDEAWRFLKGPEQTLYTTCRIEPQHEWNAPELLQKWQTVFDLRGAVNSKIESEMRATGRVKSSSGVKVELALPESTVAATAGVNLAEVFMCADVTAAPAAQLGVKVDNADGAKCPRCWNFRSLGGQHGTCVRCDDALENSPKANRPGQVSARKPGDVTNG